jgi:hypothetical protein
MARNLPDTRIQKLQWLEARIDAWVDSATEIGISAEQSAEMASRITAARSAFNNAELVRAQSKASTGSWYSAIDNAVELGSALVDTIKAYARANNDPSVYATAMVSPNDPPSPSGAPDVPENLKTMVLNTGAVEISWEGSLANRTYYEVFRRLPGQGVEGLVASIGKTRFVDETIPAGNGAVWYSVRARRGDLASDSTDIVEVRLGIPGGESSGGLALAA